MQGHLALTFSKNVATTLQQSAFIHCFDRGHFGDF